MNRHSVARSGQWLVAGMIGFGLLLTASLYVYWTFSHAPFRPLATALAERYPGSAPRVDGGKPRLDRPGERILRVVMKSNFDPADSEKAELVARDVATLAAAELDLTQFDVIEVHLFHGRREGQLSQRSIRREVGDLLFNDHE